jgi:phage FluMu protein Com
MKVKECAYFSNETIIGTPAENCNLFPQYDLGSYRFIGCEQVPILKCPYKKFLNKLISKEELNVEINKVIKNKQRRGRNELLCNG